MNDAPPSPPPPHSPPAVPPPAAAPYTPPPPAKKGLHPLAWVGIGCGAILLIGLIGLAIGTKLLVDKGKEVYTEYEKNPAKGTAELFVRMNPELEMVSYDDEAGTMTIRQVSTGEVGTFSYKDLEAGKFTWTSEEGSYTIDASGADEEGVTFESEEGRTVIGGKGAALPSWVPLPDGVTQSGSLYSSQSGGTLTGAFTYSSQRDGDELVDFYVEALEAEGFAVETSRLEAAGTRHASVSGRREGQTITATVTTDGGDTTLMLHYEGTGQ